VSKAESLEQSLPSLKRKWSEEQSKTCDAKTEKVKAESAEGKEAKLGTAKAKQANVVTVSNNAKKSDAMTTEAKGSKAGIRAKQATTNAETTPAKNQRAPTMKKSATKPKALFTMQGDTQDATSLNTKASPRKKEAELLSSEPPKPDWRQVYDLIKEYGTRTLYFLIIVVNPRSQTP
jgi:hypothetical protein